MALCPAATEAGRLGPISAKYLLDIEALLMVTAAVPEFTAVIVSVLLTPGVTVPKFRVPLGSERLPGCGWLPPTPVLTPWHPARKLRIDKRKMRLVTLTMVFDIVFRKSSFIFLL